MNKSNELIEYIKCPYCGREYLPSEIFYPDQFLGQETGIERDITGQILYYEGVESKRYETYICDKCNKQFIVEADIKFIVKEDEKNNPNSNYFTPKPVKLFLNEG